MKRLIPFIMLLMAAPLASPVRADLVHRLTTSTQLSVDGAATASSRIGSTYAVSGNNMQVGSGNSDAFGGLTAGTATAAATMKAGTYDITTDGSAFSFSESYTQGDALATSAPTVGAVNNYGNMSSTAGGTVGSLGGTVSSAHAFSGVAAGGANTSATSQFVTELTIK